MPHFPQDNPFEGSSGSHQSLRVSDAARLNDIREMRNACAHTKQPMSFSVAALADVTKRLCYPRGIWTLEEDSPHGVREAFIREAILLHQIIIDGSRERGLATAVKVMQDLLASLPPLPDKQVIVYFM